MAPRKYPRSVASKIESRSVKFQTVLRIRPFSKKERDDPVLFDPLPSDATTVVLHPPPPKHGDLLSPSSVLVRQTIDPSVILQDFDFRLDQVWPVDATQDKIYFAMGLPMALATMEPLKADPNSTTQVQRTDNLIIAMGTAGSGKTYSCLGGTSIHSKRKKETDGLVPRILDSLYSQSKHHICNNRGLYFAVNLRILLVKQHKNKPSDGTIHDLLQPVAARAFSIASVSSLSLSSAGKSPIIQNTKYVKNTPLKKTEPAGSASKSSTSHYSSLDEQASVGQDSEIELQVVNGQERICRTVEEAREALQTAMTSAYRLSSARHQSHVLITMQPVLLNKAGTSTLRVGGTLAVLDMAGYSGPPTQTNRHKESLPTRNDAHAALSHCLRTIQANETIRAGQPLQQHHDTESEAASSSSSSSMERCNSFKKVPYRQHKLTMLLQPLLANNNSDKTVVTLFVTAYPGQRDYAEKKALLSEVKSFRSSLPQGEVSTGLKAVSRKKDRSSKRKNNHHMASRTAPSCDADDEGSLDVVPKKIVPPMQVRTDYTVQNPVAVAPGICHAISSSYSDDLYDNCVREPLPPPVAPSYSLLMRCSLSSSVMSPEPSAPLELPVAPVCRSAPAAFPNPRTLRVADFPGANLHSPASVKSFTSEESGPPSPPNPAQAMDVTPQSNYKVDEVVSDLVFSPMKTFNKVVHASKKKGQQVIDKMNKLSFEKEGVGEVAERLESMEIQNKRLVEENDTLRTANERLKKENDELRSRVLDCRDHEDHHPDSPASLHDDWNSNSKEQTCQNSLVDSSLLQHMAAVGGYHQSNPCGTHKTSSSTYSRGSRNYQSTFQRSSYNGT